jgi:hypothetical protein
MSRPVTQRKSTELATCIAINKMMAKATQASAVDTRWMSL